MRYCNKCGKEFFGELSTCPECGEALSDTRKETVTNPENYPDTENLIAGTCTSYPQKQHRKSKLWLVLLIIAVSIAAVAVGTVFVIKHINFVNGKKELKHQLLRDWSRIEETEGDYKTYYTLELDFSESSIDYNFVDEIYNLFNENIATYEYEVISPNEILVKRLKYDYGEVYAIEFDSDKSMMIITPSLTDSKDKEYWFHH